MIDIVIDSKTLRMIVTSHPFVLGACTAHEREQMTDAEITDWATALRLDKAIAAYRYPALTTVALAELHALAAEIVSRERADNARAIEVTPTQRFQDGGIYSRTVTVKDITYTAIGVIDEVSEEWVSWRPEGSDVAWVFGKHPASIGPLTSLQLEL